MLREFLKAELTKIIRVKFDRQKTPGFLVFIPSQKAHGDYTTNFALVLGKILQKNPADLAGEITGELNEKFSGQFRVETAGPGFINFFIGEKLLQENAERILKEKEKFGQGAKKKETVVIEYSSPNIAKPLGIHHLRTTIIGQALVNLLRFSGYKVISLSFPGDWGTQFGLLIAGYKRWGNPANIKKEPINEMLRLYVKFSAAAKEDPKLLDEGRLEFKKLEDGDRENHKLWKWFLDESLKDFERVYKLLGVKIENTIGESYYESELKKLVADALKRGLAQKGEDGSVVIAIPGSQTPEIIQKSDGATIYTTRELAAIRHRLKKWKADKILYVAANQQTFHLEQVFKCAEILGIARRNQLGHVKFGMVLAPGGKKFATREGNLVPMEDVLKEAVEKARVVSEKLNPDLSAEEKSEIARQVGIGAVKFFDLSQNRLSDIVFDWDKMLNLKGSSAPYIQYSYARSKSILRKAKESGKKFETVMQEDEEKSILRQLLHFSEAVEDAAARYEPNHLAEYLLHLAERINLFYEKIPVLTATENMKKSRLALLNAASIILKSGLGILGIEVPERM